MRRSRIIAVVLVVAAVIGVTGVVRPWSPAEKIPRGASAKSGAAPRTKVQKQKRAAKAPPAAPVAPATLRGLVVRGQVPVASARVTVRDAGLFLETRSGEDGSFSFESLPAGHFFVAALSDGESSPLVGPLPLVPGQTHEDLVLELLPGAFLSGSVQDVRTGRALAGASIRSSSGATVTDEAGRFRLGPLPYGGTFVEASAKGYEARVQWLSLDAAREYSGLQLFLRGATSLRGRVTRMGEPVSSASVWAEKGYLAARSEQFGPVTTDAEGAFELEVASGDVQLLAAAAGAARVTGPRLTVAEGGTYSELQIELGEALRAFGTVTLDGSPAERVALYLIDARSQQAAGSAVTGAGGTFAFEGIATGSYLVQVNAGATVAQRGPFEVTGGGDSAWSVEVTTARLLSGRVQPARAGVLVRWRSSEWAGGLVAETLTDAAGAFAFTGVPEGQLVVEAEADSAYARADAKAGDEVMLKLASSAVSGFVVDASNRPVTDFVIRAAPLAGGVPRLQPVLNPNGEFTLPVSPGQYELLVSAAGYGENASGTTVTVEAGRTTSNVRIALSAEGTISGVVVEMPERRPLEGVEIRVVRGRGGQGAGFERLGVYSSDASGRFEFSGVPGHAWVTFSKKGYVPFTTHASQIRDRWKGLIGIPKGTPREDGVPAPYEGVGMQLRPDTKATVLVAGVFDGSPAQTAGVLPNDEILMVDGVPVTGGVPVEQVIQRITGPAGTTVRVTFRRAGKAFDLVLRRRSIQL